MFIPDSTMVASQFPSGHRPTHPKLPNASTVANGMRAQLIAFGKCQVKQLGELHQVPRELDLMVPCPEMAEQTGYNKLRRPRHWPLLPLTRCVSSVAPLPSVGSGSPSPRPLPGPKFYDSGTPLKPHVHASAELPRGHVITGTQPPPS